MSVPIEDYALIGDCQTAALISRQGSIDWLCIPRFDSCACFAALLGDTENGRWLLAPQDEVRETRRRYRGQTLILETDYRTETGEVSVVDCMPPRSKEADLVRLVIGRRGKVRMRSELIIRFDYGSFVPWVRRIKNGIRATAGPDTLIVRSPADMHGEDYRTVAEFTVEEGQEIPFLMVWFPSHEPVPQPVHPESKAREILEHTEKWWEDWSSRCTYEGPWRDAVLRSLITLKGLTYAPTGGMLAAATTSLPEKIGGVRNWDYRFCWLRDATFTLFALMNCGYLTEAKEWREWLLRAVAGKPSQLHIMYGVAGERRLPELELPWLSGYEGSTPVRIGNEASNQFQLDVYGEVADVFHQAQKHHGLEPEEDAWRVEHALLDFLETAWDQPDEGIWEVRGPRRHFTHSKVMVWVALDRAIKNVERFGLEGKPDRWGELRDRVHREICERGYDADKNSFVQYYGAKEVDASLLMIPLVGFLPPEDRRVRGTVAAIEKELMQDGLVHRYRTESDVDGLPPGEGAFLICSYWLADNYVLQGRIDEAQQLFEHLLELRNDVGLLSEQFDTGARRLLGNFPQAFSHVGLVNTACNLSQRLGPAKDRP